MSSRVLGVFAALLLVLSPAVLPRVTAAEKTVQEWWEIAKERDDSGDLKSALEAYNSVLELNPRADNALFLRARVKLLLEDVSGARADLAAVLALNDEHADAFFLRATIRSAAGDKSAALQDLDRVIALEPEAVDPYAVRGEVHFQLGQFEPAVRDLTRAIELDPTFTAAINLRGDAYRALDRSAEAWSDYTRVLELEPEHAHACLERAWLNFYRREWAEAVADARKARELAPRAAGTTYRVEGYAEYGRGDYAAAAAALDQAANAAENSPHAAYALLVRHFARQHLGQPDDRLAAAWPTWKKDPWSQALARCVLGEISEEELDAMAAEPEDADERLGRECEAHFYIGLRRFAGDRSTARLRFTAAIATNRTDFIEHPLAQAEKDRL